MEKGVLLSAVFDKKSKTLDKQLADFEAALVKVQKQFELTGFVSASKRDGDKLHVKILAASTQPPPGMKVAAKSGGGWGGKSAKDVTAEVKQSLGWGPKK